MKLKKIQWMCLAMALLLNTSLFSQFEKVGNGFLRSVRCLYSDSLTNGLIAGGEFMWTADSLIVDGIAIWNGIAWDSLATRIEYVPPGTNVSAPVYKFFRYKNDLYANGSFSGIYMSDSLPKTIGKLDTASHTWQPLNCRLGGGITNISSEVDDTMYVTGYWDTLCGFQESCVFQYDGNNFHPFAKFNALPYESSNYVGYVFKYLGVLYMTGLITDPSTSIFKSFMKWDGSNWVDVPGFTSPAPIKKILIYNNELYIGGYFFMADGAPGNCITKFDGTNWYNLGGGISYDLTNPTCCNPYIVDFNFLNDDLYVVGLFNYAGGIPAQNIAKWDGTDWCGFGSVFDNNINTIGVWNDSIYIAGGFKFIDGDTVNYIAKWTGGTLSACGHLNVGINESINANESFTIYPNPTSNQITIEFELTETNNTSIEIKNVLGQTVKTITNKAFVKGSNKIEIDVSEFTNGIYFIQLQNGNGVVNGKFVKE
jgi:trimeric autotransporter adhesin